MQKVEIILSSKEYKYLIYTLLNKHNNLLSKIKVSSSADTTKLSLDEDTAYEIRELASDEVALHFDENYEPTEEGWILEHFIDKFYFDIFFPVWQVAAYCSSRNTFSQEKCFFQKTFFLKKRLLQRTISFPLTLLKTKMGATFIHQVTPILFI